MTGRDRPRQSSTRHGWQSSVYVALLLSFLACRADAPVGCETVFLLERVGEAEKDFDATLSQSSWKEGRLSGQLTIDNETRVCLTPPLPSRVTFEVQVPCDGKLQFGTGVFSSKSPTLPSRIRFQIHVEAGGAKTTVFEDVVRRWEPNRWREQEVDLSAWSGRRARITFETTPMRRGLATERLSSLIPMWSHPVLNGSAGRGEHPNVFLISIDCLRRDHLSAYGYHRETTPNIDRFARDGVVFETALASAPETMPAHMSMFTGLLPSFHGARRWRRLSPAVAYGPELFARSGYEVSAVVTGAFLSQSFGFERGFHTYRFFDDPGAGKAVDSVLEAIRRAKDRKQFVFLHLFDPHWPYVPPKELIERFGPRRTDLSEVLKRISNQDQPPQGSEETRQVIDLYDAEVFHTDREVGRFLEELDSLGLYDDSLIILLGDHGEAFYEHGLWQHTLSVYEEMIHIPLIVKWPGGQQTGRSSIPVHQIDVFPTLLEAAGIAAPPHQGISLKAVASEPPPQPHSRVLVSEAGWISYGRMSMQIALRKGDDKYIAFLEDEVSKGWPPSMMIHEEIYDLSRDPTEEQDRASTSPDRLDGFREHLRAFFEEAARRRPEHLGEDIVLDEATRKRLEALGYADSSAKMLQRQDRK